MIAVFEGFLKRGAVKQGAPEGYFIRVLQVISDGHAPCQGSYVYGIFVQLPVNIEMPAFGLVFIGIFIGLCGGWIVSIYSGISHARRHRLADKKIKELEKEIKKADLTNIDLSKDQNRGKTPSE